MGRDSYIFIYWTISSSEASSSCAQVHHPKSCIITIVVVVFRTIITECHEGNVVLEMLYLRAHILARFF